MKIKTCLFCFLLSFVSYAQIDKNNAQKMGYVLTEKDSILSDTIQLPEIIISKEKLDPEAQKQFLILQARVYKTYPYARIASERLVNLNKGMAGLSSNKEKKKYFKIVENYLSNEFEDKLKKLSRKQGQILVKLICRQTGSTTYDLVKSLKSGWKAFWANTTANVFDISLKTGYAPYEVNEDYLIETILIRAFESGGLEYQVVAHPIDYDNLNNYWQEKVKNQKKEQKTVK